MYDANYVDTPLLYIQYHSTGANNTDTTTPIADSDCSPRQIFFLYLRTENQKLKT